MVSFVTKNYVTTLKLFTGTRYFGSVSTTENHYRKLENTSLLMFREYRGLYRTSIIFSFQKKHSDFSVQKSEIFFWTEKKFGFSVQKSEIFFWTKKKNQIFSAEIRDFFVQKKISDFCTENPSVF